MNLEEIYVPIRQELGKVEERLATIVNCGVYPVCELYHYVLSSGGKRIRPALVLLSAKSLDYSHPMVTDLAGAVELIHMTSLIHDDIVDSTKLRRGRPTAHIIWPTEIVVTIGDYLFSRAMEMLAEHEDCGVVKLFSRTVENMAEGELLQVINRRNIELTEEEYISIISNKTASLISASCEIVSKLASAPDSYSGALSGYGLNLGISYQIMDDLLDLTSTDNQLGKPARNSIREGILTLPMIHTLRNGNGESREQLPSILTREKVNDVDLQQAVDLISDSGALYYAQTVAEVYTENAKRNLAVLKDSSAKRCLLSLADLIVSAHPVKDDRHRCADLIPSRL